MENTIDHYVLNEGMGLLTHLIQERIKHTFSDNSHTVFTINRQLPDHWQFSTNPVCQFIYKEQLSFEEVIVLFLGLSHHVLPGLLDFLLQEVLPSQGDFPQLGFSKGKVFRGFIPTGETVLFLLAGDNLKERLQIQQVFSEEYIFARKRILWLEAVPEGEPEMCGKIIMSQEYVEQFTTGSVARPKFSMSFPAQLIETKLEWSDLVLHPDTLDQIRDLEIWVRHHNTLMQDWEMHRKIKPGYRALFHGPPGTGKTLTASLLGKTTARDVYRVELAMVVSKFIGETEKNLANLFAKAENKEWILFFDEADALFGKRTNVRDAHDKYANQEVSYLLQRVEMYNGLVILATNFKSNIDDAFSRRFQSIIYFPMPNAEERLRLWQKVFPAQVRLNKDINMHQLADKYKVSGAEIINIVQFACLRALHRGVHEIRYQDLYEGIKKEFQKEGRIMR